MRCIFCKTDSSGSKTVEHIIPESFGNTEHILPRGVVCDKCNNYFSREVEKPLLACDYFTYLRFWGSIRSKKGVIPPAVGFYLNSGSNIGLRKDKDGLSIYALTPEDEATFIEHIRNDKKGELWIPVPHKPPDYAMARFLGKVALEVAAQRVLEVSGGLDEIVDKRELDELRNYVRRGHLQKKVWTFNERRIYPENAMFYEEGYGYFDVLHEYRLLYTDSQELYLVIAFFGVEYAFNMGGSEIDGYLNWLQRNNNKSPLYP